MRLSKLLVTAVAAMLAVAGCGSSGTPAAKNAQGVTSTTITIGTTLPITGTAAAAGVGFEAGLQKAVNEVNAKGGINGHKFNLTVLDDGFDAARSVANIRRLVEDEKVFAIVSPAGSSLLPGSWPFLKGKGIPMVGPVSPPDPQLANVYLLGTSLEDQHRVIADYLSSKGVKTIGIIRPDNLEGQNRSRGLHTQAAKDGLQIVAEEVVATGSTDVSAAVLNVKAKNPDAVDIETDNTGATLILKQMQQLGWSPIVTGDSSTMGPGGTNVTKPAGSAADGIIGTQLVELPTTDTAAVQHWKSLGPPAPAANFDLQAYGNAQVFFDIVKRMGSDLSWTNFQKVAESTKNFQTGLLPPVTFGKLPTGHTGTQGAKVSQYQNGKWTEQTDWIQPK